MVTLNNPIILSSSSAALRAASAVATIDAAGESVTAIGTLIIEGGASKTLSSAGGAIVFNTAAVTFNNAGTTFRIGIQDVNTTTGIEDGTFDVYGNAVGGSGAITANAAIRVAMETGSRTYNDGELIAISIEAISRAGSDTVAIHGSSMHYNTFWTYPYITVDSGSGPAKATSSSNIFGVEFDDGTLGWLYLAYFIPLATTAISNIATYGSTSTPDEYANVFELPIKSVISGGSISIGAVAATDTFDIVLYSDPTGTPTVIETLTVNPAVSGTSASSLRYFRFASQHTLNADTLYAIAAIPTSTNTIIFAAHNMGAGFVEWARVNPFGATCQVYSRTNQTGAFTLVSDVWLPVFDLIVVGMETPSTGGGGEQVITFG